MTNVPTPDTSGEMETVTSADGTTIAYERTGSGPPLLLVHGTSANRTAWRLVLPGLEEHVTAYAVDRRGRGESGDADEYGLEQEADDVAAVVDSIDDPVTLLGHSGGGLFSLEAALRTDNLHKLILYEPSVSIDGHEFSADEVRAEMKALLDSGENEQAVVLFLQEVANFSPEELDTLRAAPTWQDRVDAAHTVYREVKVEADYEFDADRFADMTTPTMLLSGSESPPRYKSAVDAVNDALPNSRITTIDGHAHVAYYTAPERFTDEVLAFTVEPN